MNEIDILGGGPAGLASAFYAKEKNISFRLYESQKKIGGNCKTLTFDVERAWLKISRKIALF